MDGFLCAGHEALVRACHEVARLDRSVCRAGALERFSTETMTSGYEAAYQAVLEGKLLVA